MSRATVEATHRPVAARARPARRPSRALDVAQALFIPLLSIALLTILWELVARRMATVLFPPPSVAMQALIKELTAGRLVSDVAISLQRIVAGFALGSAVGALIGMLMGSSSLLRRFFDPYVNFFRFVPSIAMISPMIIWFGIGETSKIALIWYTTTWVVLLNTMAGVFSVSENKIRAARCFGASRLQVFRHVILPSTLPHILTGMRVAMAASFTTVVAAEMVAADTGLGYLIINSRLWFAIDVIFAAIVVLGLLGLLADRLFQLIEDVFFWKYRSKN
jgi:NitT/TauT family transport system permease protein